MNWLKGFAAAAIGAQAIGISISKDDIRIFFMGKILGWVPGDEDVPRRLGHWGRAAAIGCGCAADKSAAGIRGFSILRCSRRRLWRRAAHATLWTGDGRCCLRHG